MTFDKYLNEYHSLMSIGKSIIDIWFSDNSASFDTLETATVNFKNSKLKFMLSIDINEDNYSGYSNKKIALDYLIRFMDIDKLFEKESFITLTKNYNFTSDYEKEFFVTFSTTLYVLNQMYICFKSSNRNSALIDRLYTFFDDTDVSGHSKRVLNRLSSNKEKESYLKIKFAFICNSLTLLLEDAFNIKLLKRNDLLINSKYLKISTYDNNKLEQIPFELYNYDLSEKNLFIINNNLYLKCWYSFCGLLNNTKNYNICHNCSHIFFRYTNHLSNLCSTCKDNFFYECESKRKNEEHKTNKSKIKYIEEHYIKIQKHLDKSTLQQIEIIISKKHDSIRSGNDIKKIYSIVLQKYEELYPPQKTTVKGNFIY